MMQRDRIVDCLKGYASILVVFGHVIMGIRKAGVSIPSFEYPLEKFIWTFHVPLFFFLSGYVYKISGFWKSKGSRKSFLFNKCINLLIPYFSFSTIYILINSLTSGTNTKFTTNDIFQLWKTPVAQYWYIYVLFLIFLVYTLGSVFIDEKRITIILLIVSYVNTCILGLYIPIIGQVFTHVFSFGLGVCFPTVKTSSKKYTPLIIVLHLFSFFIGISYGLNENIFFRDWLRLVGIITSISVISTAVECERLKKILLLLGRNCFPIYLLHTFFTSATRIFLIKISVENFCIHLFLGMCCGILIPLLISYISSKIPVLNFLFYPVVTLKKLQGD